MFIVTLTFWKVLGQIGLVLLGVLIGGIAGFFISRKVFSNQLKKNPPINENMIRAMYRSMGRTPSEKDVKRTMKAMEQSR